MSEWPGRILAAYGILLTAGMIFLAALDAYGALAK